MEQQLQCPLDTPDQCQIQRGEALVGGRLQVQETCQTCGNGCGYMQDVSPSPEPQPAGDE